MRNLKSTQIHGPRSWDHLISDRRPAADSGVLTLAPEARLATERLVLREFVPADEDAVHSYASDPLVTVHTVWGPNSREDTRSFLADAAAQAANPDRRIFDFAVVEQDTQCLIGGASLRLTEPEHCRAELGYVIHRDFWSRGYATELAKALLRFGFDEVGLRRICATCAPDNHGSARVLQKAGMVYEGRLRSHYLVRGSWRDSLLFAAISDDFPG